VSACHSISYANVLDPERDQAAVPGDSGTSAAYRCALGQSGVPVMDVDAGDDARCEIRRFALEHDETAICRESTRPRAGSISLTSIGCEAHAFGYIPETTRAAHMQATTMASEGRS